MDITANQDPSIFRRVADGLHFRETIAAGTVLLAAAGCACSPEQEAGHVEIGTTLPANETTIGTISTTTSTTEVPATTTTEAETTTTVATAPETSMAPENPEAPERRADRIDIYGMGLVSIGMTKQEVEGLGYETRDDCGPNNIAFNIREGTSVSVGFDENNKVVELATFDSGGFNALETLSGARIGMNPAELKQIYPNLETRFFGTSSIAYVLSRFAEETGYNMWFVMKEGDADAIYLLPTDEEPGNC